MKLLKILKKLKSILKKFTEKFGRDFKLRGIFEISL